MTFKIGKFQIVLFKITVLERMTIAYDEQAARQQAEEIKNSDTFTELKARAALARAARV